MRELECRIIIGPRDGCHDPQGYPPLLKAGQYAFEIKAWAVSDEPTLLLPLGGDWMIYFDRTQTGGGIMWDDSDSAQPVVEFDTAAMDG